MGKDKVKTAEHSRDQARARNVALTAELVQRNNEASRATAELRIATRRRDEARAQANGQGGDIESVQLLSERFLYAPGLYLLRLMKHI